MGKELEDKSENILEDSKIEFYEKQLERVNYWLSFAEAKNAALIVLNFAALTFLATLFQYAPVICSISMIFFLASSFICIYSFYPNESSNTEDNLLFFGDVSKHNEAQEYVKLVSEKYFSGTDDNRNIDKLLMDYSDEILINSKITRKKYKAFRKSIIIDCLGLISCVLAIIIA